MSRFLTLTSRLIRPAGSPGIRTLRSSQRVLSSLQPPERDPNHPSLYYHPIPPPNAFSFDRPTFALSFLGKPLNTPASKTIIGWVKTGESERAASEGDDESHEFIENQNFRSFLHESIKSALDTKEGDEVLNAEAQQRVEGWLHIHDLRNVPPMGRIGDPDDIIASVMVQDGKILPGTYQPMPSYRLCTGDGPTRLTEGLSNKLQKDLEEEWTREQDEPL